MQKIIDKKTTLRKKMLLRLKRQKEVLRLRKSRIITKKFFALPEVKKARHIMFYLSLADEIETSGMIEECLRQGKNVSVPVIIRNKRSVRCNDMRPCQIFDIRNSLMVGPFGIMHPKKKLHTTLDKIDLVVVPGVAFDLEGHRLGRGGGYYDKFLSCLPENVYKIGIAFKFQILKCIPRQPHDIRIDRIIAA